MDVDRRRPRLPMEQRPGDNLRSARIAAISAAGKNSRSSSQKMEGGNAVSEANGITQFAGTANETWEQPKIIE